jgi:hypothetical protein
MFLSGGWGRRSQVDKQSEQACANREMLSGLRQKTGRHEILLKLFTEDVLKER